MARKLKTYQTSLGFFDQAIAAERAALEKRSQAENAGRSRSTSWTSPCAGPQIAHGEGERRQGAPARAAVAPRPGDPNQGKKNLTPS